MKSSHLQAGIITVYVGTTGQIRSNIMSYCQSQKFFVGGTGRKEKFKSDNSCKHSEFSCNLKYSSK